MVTPLEQLIEACVAGGAVGGEGVVVPVGGDAGFGLLGVGEEVGVVCGCYYLVG